VARIRFHCHRHLFLNDILVRLFMIRSFIALCIAMTFGGLGHLFLSKGMQSIGALDYSEPTQLFFYFISALTNTWVISGILMELAYFLLWLVILSWADVSWAVPMNAIEYVFVAILAQFFLGEEVHLTRWIGVIFISFGVILMMKSWNPETKENPSAVPT